MGNQDLFDAIKYNLVRNAQIPDGIKKNILEKINREGRVMMERPKFYPGTRVVVYATLNGKPHRSKGVVIGVDHETQRLHVRMDKVITSPTIWAHMKQCRVLKRPGPITIWIPKDLKESTPMPKLSWKLLRAQPGPEIANNFRKFVEVV